MKTSKEIRNELYHYVSDILFALRGEYINAKERKDIKDILLQLENKPQSVEPITPKIDKPKNVKPFKKIDNIRVWTPNK